MRGKVLPFVPPKASRESYRSVPRMIYGNLPGYPRGNHLVSDVFGSPKTGRKVARSPGIPGERGFKKKKKLPGHRTLK